jgi:curved DNA-binding protein CbpA
VHPGEALRLLGLVPGYSEDDVVRAYRRHAVATHPDLGGDPIAFSDILHARDTLLRQLHRPHFDVVIVDDTSRWGSFVRLIARPWRKPSRHLL